MKQYRAHNIAPKVPYRASNVFRAYTFISFRVLCTLNVSILFEYDPSLPATRCNVSFCPHESGGVSAAHLYVHIYIRVTVLRGNL